MTAPNTVTAQPLSRLESQPDTDRVATIHSSGGTAKERQSVR
jgi:hypothetical protein